MAFEYRQNGVSSFLKVRREMLEADQVTKTFLDRAQGLRTVLLERGLPERSVRVGDPGHHGGGVRRVVVSGGGGDTASCPYLTAPSVKPGEGDIVPAEDRRFAYLWEQVEGVALKAALATAKRIILATDDDKAGRILREELAVRLGRTAVLVL